MTNHLYLGIKGGVACVDKLTGSALWHTRLKGRANHNICVDGERVFAHSGGRLFAIHSATGKVLWENPLKGLGYGHCIMATATSRGANDQTITAAAYDAEQAIRPIQGIQLKKYRRRESNPHEVALFGF